MAAPKFSPVGPTEGSHYYTSPDHVPDAWLPDRPGEIEGFQPEGRQLGSQGPDQGFALRIAALMRPDIRVQAGEDVDDVVRGCLGVGLRRASLFSRAPVVHDLTIAFTMWGFLDAAPPPALVELRRPLFEGLRHVDHHYAQARAIADMAPESTLRMTPGEVTSKYPADWKSLLGV